MSPIERLEPRRLLAATAGEIDLTFGGGDGRATTSAADGFLIGLQPDGKILLAAGSGNFVYALDRLNADGSPDATFHSVAAAQNAPSFFAISPSDGSIAELVSTGVRVFNPDGSVRTAFAGDGIASYDSELPLPFTPERIAWQGNKPLLIGGPTVNTPTQDLQTITVVRLSGNGTIDTTFGQNGTSTAIGQQEAHIIGVGVTDDGGIDVGLDTSHTFDGVTTFATATVARLLPDGQIDQAYKDKGGVINIASSDVLTPRSAAFAIGPDGSAYDVFSSEADTAFTVGRCDPDGTLSLRADVEIDPSSGEFFIGILAPRQILPQPDGKMLLIGNSPSLNGGWGVARLNADGSVDRTYGDNGFLNPDVSFTITASQGLMLQSDGKLLVAGKLYRRNGTFTVERYDPGPLDLPSAQLNRFGKLIVTGTQRDDVITLAARKRDGRIVARVGDFFVRSFAPSSVKGFAIFAGDGDDSVTIGPGLVRGVYIDGGANKDTLRGGHQDDILVGGGGNDRIYGGGGNDQLIGGRGDDRLFGGEDSDFVRGGAGHDAAFDDPIDTFDSIEVLFT
jgi:uncharacterized delta-60 repeat protein